MNTVLRSHVKKTVSQVAPTPRHDKRNIDPNAESIDEIGRMLDLLADAGTAPALPTSCANAKAPDFRTV